MADCGAALPALPFQITTVVHPWYRLWHAALCDPQCNVHPTHAPSPSKSIAAPAPPRAACAPTTSAHRTGRASRMVSSHLRGKSMPSAVFSRRVQPPVLAAGAATACSVVQRLAWPLLWHMDLLQHLLPSTATPSHLYRSASHPTLLNNNAGIEQKEPRQ